MLKRLAAHMDWFLSRAVWTEQPETAGLWWSMLDVATGKPSVPERAAGVSKRCYRWIESPQGCNLYWDGPLVVACRALSAETGEARYAEAAEAYVRRYLELATSSSGLLFWGNHYFLDAAGRPVWFTGDSPLRAVDETHSSAPYHETRPLPVPWRLLLGLDRERTLRNLRAHTHHLVSSSQVGRFNRHADGKGDHAFLEAGGMLALALAYLANSGDADAAQTARTVLRFSLSFRDPQTGLVPVSPVHKRWDQECATSEIGVWCGAALAAADLLSCSEMRNAACAALSAWLERAWRPEAGAFCGRTFVKTGEHDRAPQSTIYQPGTWANPWEPLFPAHDYPLQTAEAALRAWELTQDKVFSTGVERWVTVLKNSLPARNGRGAYAEHYGRAIHFLWRAGKLFDRRDWSALANDVCREATAVLWHGEVCQTHPWEARVEAVDGMGWLALAMIALARDREPDVLGMFW